MRKRIQGNRRKVRKGGERRGRIREMRGNEGRESEEEGMR